MHGVLKMRNFLEGWFVRWSIVNFYIKLCTYMTGSRMCEHVSIRALVCLQWHYCSAMFISSSLWDPSKTAPTYSLYTLL